MNPLNFLHNQLFHLVPHIRVESHLGVGHPEQFLEPVHPGGIDLFFLVVELEVADDLGFLRILCPHPGLTAYHPAV